MRDWDTQSLNARGLAKWARRDAAYHAAVTLDAFVSSDALTVLRNAHGDVYDERERRAVESALESLIEQLYAKAKR